MPSTPAENRVRDLLEQAEVLYKGDRHAEAEPLLREALQLAEPQLPQKQTQVALVCDRLGYNCLRRDNLGEAESLFRRALALRRDAVGVGDVETAASFNNLGLLLRVQGRLAEAEVLLRRAQEVFERLLGREHEKSIRALTNLSLLALDQCRPQDAERCLRAVLDCRIQPGKYRDMERSRCLYRLANILCAEERFSEAEPLYREAVTCLGGVSGESSYEAASVRLSLSRCLRARGQLSDAHECLIEGLQMISGTFGDQHLHSAAGFVELGVILEAQGKLGEAESYLRKALDIRLHTLGASAVETVEAQHVLGAMLLAQGRLMEAEELLHAAAEGFETSRLYVSYEGLERAAVGFARSPLSRWAVCLARCGRVGEAWAALERGLARGLLDEVAARRDRRLDSEEAAQLQLLRTELVRHAASTSQDLREAEVARTRLLEFEEKLSGRYGTAAGEVHSVDRIQSRLRVGTALVVWLDLPHRPLSRHPIGESWAFVLPARGEPLCVAIQGGGQEGAWRPEDHNLADRVRHLLARPPYGQSAGELDRLLHELREQRLSPLERLLEKQEAFHPVRKLIVVPIDAMAGIPLEALSEKYEVTYAPSGTLLGALTKSGVSPRASPGPEVLVVGDPATGPGGTFSSGLGPLPGARAEAEAIDCIARSLDSPSKGRCDKLIGSDASEASLDRLAQSGRLATYRYLHFAVHALVDDAAPLRSELLLAQDQLLDPTEQAISGRPICRGSLTAGKVLRTWSLNAELVVLSGCQTALGKGLGGEGTIGFVQTFLIAGVRSVLVSLWKVDDVATSLLMSRFYEGILVRRLAKSEALREAKRWLRNMTRQEAARHIGELGLLGVSRGACDESAVSSDSADLTGGVSREDLPFDHPFYWAAFVLFGPGDRLGP